MSNPDSIADSGVPELEEEFTEETLKEDATKDMEMGENFEDELSETRENQDCPDLALESVYSKLDAGSNQENNDTVEDCINLNLEDEENFDEVCISSHKMDERWTFKSLAKLY